MEINNMQSGFYLYSDYVETDGRSHDLGGWFVRESPTAENELKEIFFTEAAKLRNDLRDEDLEGLWKEVSKRGGSAFQGVGEAKRKWFFFNQTSAFIINNDENFCFMKRRIKPL